MKPESSVQAVIRLAEETAIDKGSMGTKWWSEPRRGIVPELARLVIHARHKSVEMEMRTPGIPERPTADLHPLETPFQTNHPVSLSLIEKER